MTTVGCAAIKPEPFNYPDFAIIRLNEHELSKVCNATHWDNGLPIAYNQFPAGCWSAEKKVIYVQNNCAGAKAIPHELAHALMNVPEPSESGYDWH